MYVLRRLGEAAQSRKVQCRPPAHSRWARRQPGALTAPRIAHRADALMISIRPSLPRGLQRQRHAPAHFHPQAQEGFHSIWLFNLTLPSFRLRQFTAQEEEADPASLHSSRETSIQSRAGSILPPDSRGTTDTHTPMAPSKLAVVIALVASLLLLTNINTKVVNPMNHAFSINSCPPPS